MRNVVTEFYCKTLQGLVRSEQLSTFDKVLVVCGGPLDETVMRLTGFVDFTITNLETRHQGKTLKTSPMKMGRLT